MNIVTLCILYSCRISTWLYYYVNIVTQCVLYSCRISTAFYYYKEAEQTNDPSLKADLLYHSYEVLHVAFIAGNITVNLSSIFL